MLGWFSPHLFLGRAQRRLMRQGVPVFTYHKIAEPPPATRDPFLYVSTVRFDEQLAGLRRAGCVSACLGEAFREPGQRSGERGPEATDRKSTRLNSSHI